MKRARDDDETDFDALELDRERQRQDDATEVERFYNYPPNWFDGDER